MLLRQFKQADFYLNLARKYGDVVYFKLGPVDAYLVSHPDDIRDVLVVSHKKFGKLGKRLPGQIMLRALLGNGLLVSDGDFHLRQRRLMQPAFHRERIAGYARVMVEYAAQVSERWRQLPSGVPLDMADEMRRLTLYVVGQTLFGAAWKAMRMQLAERRTSSGSSSIAGSRPFTCCSTGCVLATMIAFAGRGASSTRSFIARSKSAERMARITATCFRCSYSRRMKRAAPAA